MELCSGCCWWLGQIPAIRPYLDTAWHIISLIHALECGPWDETLKFEIFSENLKTDAGGYDKLWIQFASPKGLRHGMRTSDICSVQSRNLFNLGIAQRIFGILIMHRNLKIAQGSCSIPRLLRELVQSQGCANLSPLPRNSGLSPYKQSNVKLLPMIPSVWLACFLHPSPT